MANEPKLKVKFGADTSEFEKGAKNVKSNLKDLDKTTSKLSSAFGSIFGVDTSKFEQIGGAIEGLGSKLQSTGSTGGKAFGTLLTSAGKLGAGIAAIGVGALVTSFKLLNDEAQNFFSLSGEGAKMKAGLDSWVSTYVQAFHDLNTEMGRSMATFETNVKKNWKTLWLNLKNVGLQTLKSIGDSWGNEKTFLQSFTSNMIGAYTQNKTAKSKANKAEELGQQLYVVDREQKNDLVVIAKLEAEIADKRYEASLSENSTSERLEAIKAAQDAVNQKYSKLINYQKKRVELMKQLDDLAGNTDAESDATLQTEVQLVNYQTQRSTELKAISKTYNTLNKQQKEEKEEAKKAAEIKAKADADHIEALKKRKSIIDTNLDVSDSAKVATQSEEIDLAPAKLVVELDEESAENVTVELSDILTTGFEAVGESLGGLLGDLVTGGDAWGNFADSALNALGEMAIQVGKIAVQAGVAMLAIKGALKFGNPYIAIAAGVGLIALGYVVSAGLSNAGSGTSTTSGDSYTASSSSSNISSAYEREFTVNVEGTLKADGNQLVAVINNVNDRKTHTT